MLGSTDIYLLPDRTFFVQLGIFLVVALVLNRLVFRPTLRLIALRRAKTEGDRKTISEVEQKTQRLISEYEQRLGEAKQKAFQEKEAIRREGENQGKRIIQEVRKASLAEIESIKQTIALETKRAQEELDRQAASLGQSLAQQVLGRTLDA